MTEIKIGRYIENRDPNDGLQIRLEKAVAEYMARETLPPTVAMVHPMLIKEETKMIIAGHPLTVIPGNVGRWITWIGKNES